MNIFSQIQMWIKKIDGPENIHLDVFLNFKLKKYANS